MIPPLGITALAWKLTEIAIPASFAHLTCQPGHRHVILSRDLKTNGSYPDRQGTEPKLGEGKVQLNFVRPPNPARKLLRGARSKHTEQAKHSDDIKETRITVHQLRSSFRNCGPHDQRTHYSFFSGSFLSLCVTTSCSGTVISFLHLWQIPVLPAKSLPTCSDAWQCGHLKLINM